MLGNLQVVLVGVLAWLILRERPSNRSLAAIPVALVGVVLISGAFEQGAYGKNPGTAVSRTGSSRRSPTPASCSCCVKATVTCAARRGRCSTRRSSPAWRCIPIGLAIGDLDWTPDWKAQGYLLLLALSSQALGWLLISITLPRLPAALTSVLLTFQPVLSVLFAWAILNESPSGLQLGGVSLVLCGLLIVSAGRTARRPAPEPGYVATAAPRESLGS